MGWYEIYRRKDSKMPRIIYKEYVGRFNGKSRVSSKVIAIATPENIKKYIDNHNLNQFTSGDSIEKYALRRVVNWLRMSGYRIIGSNHSIKPSREGGIKVDLLVEKDNKKIAIEVKGENPDYAHRRAIIREGLGQCLLGLSLADEAWLALPTQMIEILQKDGFKSQNNIFLFDWESLKTIPKF